jgi:hypothetical protein
MNQPQTPPFLPNFDHIEHQSLLKRTVFHVQELRATDNHPVEFIECSELISIVELVEEVEKTVLKVGEGVRVRAMGSDEFQLHCQRYNYS